MSISSATANAKKCSCQTVHFLFNINISRKLQSSIYRYMSYRSNFPTFQIFKFWEHMCEKKTQTMQEYTFIHTLIIKSFAFDTYICYGTFLKTNLLHQNTKDIHSLIRI